ncbi:hypothetical protein OB955_16835 [Halobacteria archaeon AArc-m2/3/4]|uniref:Uncharacterized protein n=1 Tax=Natronoglomus mannanivorans TaxID=2979990 RepID=A0AAP2Z3M9_9EURY|nr:hypothetical protein [Halobacteria archaeon AArc-xg1-1]MCU4974391.1 hypothetical protein [Halobacteria archaeon AArc-m2/3/4]
MDDDHRVDDDGEVEIDIERGDDRDGDGDEDEGRSSESGTDSTATHSDGYTPSYTPTRPHGRDQDHDSDHSHDQRRDYDDLLEAETTHERQLEDELGRIDLLTTPEGYVEGRVTDLTSIDETTVRLEVTLPHDVCVDFTLEKPIPWSEEFLLARIVEDVGYDASSIGYLLGETVYLTRTDIGPEADEDDGDWLTASLPPLIRDVLGREEDPSPQWRLVDPLERPAPTPEGLSEGTIATLAAGAVLVGVVVAVLGAVVGATGGLAVPIAALAYAVPGLVLVLIGLFVAFVRALDGGG